MANTPVVVLDDTMTSIANAIRSKTGGTATMTPGQMPAQIASIPTGTLGIPREVDANGVYGMPTVTDFSLPANANDVGTYAFTYAFYKCSSLTSVDLSSLTTVSGSYAFSSVFDNCSRLTSVDLSSLATMSGANAFNEAFRNCTGLTSVALSSLTTVSGSSAFNSAFSGCTSLTSVSFPALTANSFGYYTDQFRNMLNGVTGCTLHFPAATQTKIETMMSGYPNFGGTNTTVLFDL